MTRLGAADDVVVFPYWVSLAGNREREAVGPSNQPPLLRIEVSVAGKLAQLEERMWTTKQSEKWEV